MESGVDYNRNNAWEIPENEVNTSSTGRGIYSLQLNGSRISLLSCYHFSLMDLVQTFLQEHSAEQPVDSVVVKSAFYGKKLKRPNHEFVLFELGNTQNPGLRNHVVLDRKRLAGSSVLSSVQQSNSTTARDEFRFSCDGNREKLLNKCNLTPYETIEIIEFPLDDPLPFYELAIVALATSLQRDYYHLLQANCYWFAGLVWEQVLEMYPDAKHKILRGGVRGTFGSLFSYTPDELERDEIKFQVQSMLSEIVEAITGSQTVCETTGAREQSYDSSSSNTQSIYGGADTGLSSAPDTPSAGALEWNPLPAPLLEFFQSLGLYHLIRQYQSSNRRILYVYQRPKRMISHGYSERHKQVFPAGFDVSSSSSSMGESYYAFSPGRLYDVLTSGYNPKHHVEDIIVKSASHCNKNTAPKYEFILLEVEDRRSPGLKNFIVLGRNVGEPSKRPRGIRGIFFNRSFAAKDEFRVSYDGDKRKLLAQCDLQDHKTLETLVFKSEEPLLLYQFATLVRAVSFQLDKYNIINATCYWFSGLIWDCILRMRPSAYYEVSQGQSRGAFLSWLRQSTNTVELQMTYEYADQELLDVEKKFTVQKQRWTHSHDAQLHEEVEALRRRVRELEAQLNASPDPSLH